MPDIFKSERSEAMSAQLDIMEATQPGPLSVGQMLQGALASGVTADNVAVLEKLMDLYERDQARQAEKEFASAFVALQAELLPIVADTPVPNNDGSVRYKFARYEDIMATVRPLLLKHGFTVSFSMSFSEGRVTQACTLQHTGGHSRTNQFTARIGRGPPGATETQGDGAASTYAKRFALCDALNIVIERDSDGRPPEADARIEGAPITPDKAQYLRELVRDTKSDEAAFLKFAGAAKYEEIGSARYDSLVAALHRKAKR
jgi:hypothetical protein